MSVGSFLSLTGRTKRAYTLDLASLDATSWMMLYMFMYMSLSDKSKVKVWGSHLEGLRFKKKMPFPHSAAAGCTCLRYGVEEPVVRPSHFLLLKAFEAIRRYG